MSKEQQHANHIIDWAAFKYGRQSYDFRWHVWFYCYGGEVELASLNT